MANTAHKIEIAPEVVEIYKNFKQKRQYKWLIFKLNQETFQMEITNQGAPNTGVAEFVKAFPDTDARYGIYDLPIQNKYGGSGSKLILFIWCPSTAGRNNMFYASSRRSLDVFFQGTEDKQVTTRKAIEEILNPSKKGNDDDDEFGPDA